MPSGRWWCDGSWRISRACCLTSRCFFIPLLALPPTYLWKWWTIAPGVDPLLDAKQPYLIALVLLVRAVFYFALLSLVALVLRRRSIAQDSDGAAQHTLIMRKFGIGGIPGARHLPHLRRLSIG